MKRYEDIYNYFTDEAADFIRTNIINSGGNEILFGCFINNYPFYKKENNNHDKNYYNNDNEDNNYDNNDSNDNNKEDIGKKDINNYIEKEITQNKIISNVELIFRGNISSVNVDEELLQKYDLVIHNHPSGNLSPSTNDQYFANFCAENGIAFGIIDNDVQNIYFVVPIPSVIKLEPVSESEAAYYLSNANKKIIKHLPDFKQREEQLLMIEKISSTINDKKSIIIEAGTGIGKSLAYLIPSVIYSLKNKVKTVISTNTIALQEQLYYKDLPLVSKILNKDIKFKILLGRGNYLCKLKYDLIKKNFKDSLFEDSVYKEFDQIKEFVKGNFSGLLTDLNFQISNELKKEINSSAETCLKSNCKYYSTCYYYKSRKEVTNADIIIVNHSLYFSSELNPDNQVLPKHRILVFDEAHNLEDVIDKTLVKVLDFKYFFKIIEKFYSLKNNKGYLKLILREYNYTEEKKNKIYNDIKEQIQALKYSFEIMLNYFKYIYNKSNKTNKNIYNNKSDTISDTVNINIKNNENYTNDKFLTIHKNIKNHKNNSYINNKSKNNNYINIKTKNIYKNSDINDSDIQNNNINTNEITNDNNVDNIKFEMLFKELIKILDKNEKDEFDTILKDIIILFNNLNNSIEIILYDMDRINNSNSNNSQLLLKYYLKNLNIKISDFIVLLKKFIIEDYEDEYNWIDIKSENIIFSYYDYQIKQEFLKNIIYKVDSTIFTSATLTTNKNFNFFKEQLLINDIYLNELVLNSPFNYKQNAKIYIPSNINEPSYKDFINEIKINILEIILLNKGNAFILTTSYYDMWILFKYLNDKLIDNNINLFMQGYRYSKKKIIELFKSNENSVLLGTSTFWEGIDIPGQNLSLLIITRLPFKVPSNPLVKIKSEIIEKQNKNKFMDLMLPYAALKLKQGFGRLIRKEDDKGACFIFDKRIRTKFYGKIIINSLPEIDIVYDRFKNLKKNYEQNFIK